MESKKFSCKMEEVPVIAGFVADNLEADLVSFGEYSPMFTAAYVQSIRAKREVCLELERSNVVIQRLKSVTATLVEKEVNLRPLLNKVEGYVKLAGGSLNVAPSGFGLAVARKGISSLDDEGIIASLKAVQKNIQKNVGALQAVGLKQELIDELDTALTDIDRINNEQNALGNERNLTTASNVKDYNELWSLIAPVLETGRLLYRNVDNEKLKQFTLRSLVSRVNATGRRKAQTNSTDSTPAT
jgi:hypothetical protein